MSALSEERYKQLAEYVRRLRIGSMVYPLWFNANDKTPRGRLFVMWYVLSFPPDRHTDNEESSSWSLARSGTGSHPAPPMLQLVCSPHNWQTTKIHWWAYISSILWGTQLSSEVATHVTTTQVYHLGIKFLYTGYFTLRTAYPPRIE